MFVARRRLLASVACPSGVGYGGTGEPPPAGAAVPPFEADAATCHHIPQQKHQVTNWAECDAGLRAPASLTVWFTPDAVAAWTAAPRTGRGGQPTYSALAIVAASTLRAPFRLALRQTEGLIGSIFALLGLDLADPNHKSRRAETLEVPPPRCGREPLRPVIGGRPSSCGSFGVAWQVPPQGFCSTPDGMVGDALQHAAQIGFRIEPVELGGGDQRGDRCGTLAAGVGAGQPSEFSEPGRFFSHQDQSCGRIEKGSSCASSRAAQIGQ